MGKFIKVVSSDGYIAGYAVDTTDVVSEAEQIHGTSAVVTAALGRLLTATSIMGHSLKHDGFSVTTRINGDGLIGSILCVSDSDGNVRGYVEQNVVELPLNCRGKLDVSGAIGSGSLTVSKDLGLKEPYISTIELISGEIAEDITQYYGVSEQVPSICALGVLVNPDLTVKHAGGFLIQLLPGAPEEVITALEECTKEFTAFTAMQEHGWSLFDIMKNVLSNFTIELLEESQVKYKCKCSEERFERGLISLGIDEIQNIISELSSCNIKCQFCGKNYVFSAKKLENLKNQIKIS